MSLPSTLGNIVEYRGVEGLVAAKVTVDDNDSSAGHGYVTGDVFAIAGVAEISKAVEQSSEAHYYDNIPAVVIDSVGADTITINASAIPIDVVAELTGQTFISAKGALVEGEATAPYFAIGYKTQKTDGSEVYVWRYKGKFSLGDETHTTKDNGTSANGQTLTYTGINTTHKFTANGNKGAKALIVDTGKDLADVSNFFASVVTPDTLAGKTAYTATITQGSNTTLVVKRNGQVIETGATIYAGDLLQITVTGGTVTVGGSAFISGDIHVVTGNTTIVSTH